MLSSCLLQISRKRWDGMVDHTWEGPNLKLLQLVKIQDCDDEAHRERPSEELSGVPLQKVSV